MYKKLIVCAGLLTILGTHAYAESNLTGCAAKKQEVSDQIEYARTHENKNRVAGLQKALRELEAHCTDEGLLKERQAKVAEKERKVAERQSDLAEAKAKGDTKKIERRQEKLEQAQKELDAAKKDLTR